MDSPAALDPKGIVIHVRLTPKSRVARIAGTARHGEKPVLRAYVTAPPEDGKANAALAQMIAAWLGMPKSAVTVASGQKSRLKSVLVAGDSAALLGKVSALLRGTAESASSATVKEKHNG
jgi:uncharacterized protein YggU (UPF0235/DUF167 family)